MSVDADGRMDLPQVEEGVLEGGKSLDTVDERGRELDRRRVEAVVGAAPVLGLHDQPEQGGPEEDSRLARCFRDWEDDIWSS